MQQEITLSTPFQFGFDAYEINMKILLMHGKEIKKKIMLTTMKNRIFWILSSCNRYSFGAKG